MNFILDFRERKTGGAVTGGILTQGSVESLIRFARVTFLIHGYNVNRNEGRDSLGRLAAHMSSAPDQAIVAVLWPGDHWSGVFSYSFEGRDADATGTALAKYIVEVAALSLSTKIAFISHSLGARVVMVAASRLVEMKYSIPQICLMAAAIDDTSLANSRVYRGITEKLGRVAVLSSRHDRVLKYAYPAGDFFQAFLFPDEYSDGALGYRGPRGYKQELLPKQILAAPIPDNRNCDHDHYIPSSTPSADQRYMNQISAATFVDEVVRGVSSPIYE